MKLWLVVSCNSDGEPCVEFIGKDRADASAYLEEAVGSLLDQFIANDYGDSYEDFEYYVNDHYGEAYCDGVCYYYRVVEYDYSEV